MNVEKSILILIPIVQLPHAHPALMQQFLTSKQVNTRGTLIEAQLGHQHRPEIVERLRAVDCKTTIIEMAQSGTAQRLDYQCDIALCASGKLGELGPAVLEVVPHLERNVFLEGAHASIIITINYNTHPNGEDCTDCNVHMMI